MVRYDGDTLESRLDLVFKLFEFKFKVKSNWILKWWLLIYNGVALSKLIDECIGVIDQVDGSKDINL